MSGPADSTTPQPRVAPLRAVDLRGAEAQVVEATGVDFTEAKEGLVDALLRLTVQHCTGEGAEGAVIYGARPSSKIVSGFLLPRFDQNLQDETTDIHIATMGADLQLATGRTGEIVVRPNLTVYVRELPSWNEISDPRYEMMPQAQLSRETRRNVEERARAFIRERLQALPTVVDDEEEQERAGAAIARAERSHEVADNNEEARVDVDPTDVDARGTARAFAETAAREEQAANAYRQRSRQNAVQRAERIATISAIRREAFDRAFAEIGIRLIAQQPGGPTRAMTANDVEDASRSDVIEAGLEDVATAEPTAPLSAQDARAQEEGPPPATGAIGPLRAGIGAIEDRFAAPLPIPQKWRRLALDLGEFRFEASSETSRAEATAAFSRRFLEALDAAIARWLATEEGQRDAYRPNERILPSNFASEQNWNTYLRALRSRRPAVAADVRPDLTGVNLVIDLDPDFVDPSRLNLRVAIQNDAAMPSGRDASAFEHAIFQVRLELDVPPALHRPLQLDRVEPSYRFRDWLEYPAMGLNCGVEQLAGMRGVVSLRTTWAPRYVQPRVEPRRIEGVPTSYAELSDQRTDSAQLLALADAYDRWIEEQSRIDVGGSLPEDVAAEERASHVRDLDAYRRESQYIRAGIEVLREAQAAHISLQSTPQNSQSRSALTRTAIPWQAWLRTNEAFAAYGQGQYTNWHLFQLAFILAHIPTLASRMPEYSRRFDAFRDELSASLLYFQTGGGKSEAFFGLLIFNLFLDRLRGKQRGVTALVRYPLRLLTLQQARRLTKILVNAELVRLRAQIPGWPFEIGFWVGSGNTPNRVAQGFGAVPTVTVAAHPDDTALLNPPEGDTEAALAAKRRSARYRETLEAYDKLRKCPCCGSPTGMRKYPSQHGRIGIVCFNDTSCEWNGLNRSQQRVPLPFLLTDDTIYQRAPSVVLGTVDKLALIGQHDRTINAIVGMFGAARYMDPQSQHLFVPRGQRALAKAEEEGLTRLRPAFANGAVVFHDPFPSLVIQDEGHLLDESLGTFSGLFETTLECLLTRLANGLLRDVVSTWSPGGAQTQPRLAKVIAATATISDPDRQLRVLYQRESLRFPCPGPNLYESFYAAPRRPRRAERREYEQSLAPQFRPEKVAPRMRTYMSVMTNGRSHTMTTSAVVSAYHLAITRIWNLLLQGRDQEALERLTQALDADDALTPLRARALADVLQGPRGADVLATLLDLHRISLTYVTNKKGGDQIIETLAAQVDRDQRADSIVNLPFVTDLISGGVTIAEIQAVMESAEGAARPDVEFPSLGESLRNIVATSAISHGVDVDKFNAMFFAGLPSDIAEYIQASSRVGRTHVGFSLFVPTPHSRRDRYVVETHDQFHRFLERMIPPPAVQRWADRAIRRIMPSVLQAYLCGLIEQETFASAGDKSRARSFTSASSIKAWAEHHPGGNYPAAVRAVTEFALQAVGLDGRGENGIGSTTHAEHYRRFIEDRIRELLERITYRSDPSQLSNFWKTMAIRPPMTSLRDVDAGGIILGAARDPYRGRGVPRETIRQVMRIIRGQRLAVRSEVDADPAPIDAEDR